MISVPLTECPSTPRAIVPGMAITTSQPAAKGYPASGTERKKVVENWKKVSSDAAEVKARIDKRLKEADDAVRKSSK